jgi:hypothetical protein
MKFNKRLRSHIGKLICLKTQLYWFYQGGWDNNPGRVCILISVQHGRFSKQPVAEGAYHRKIIDRVGRVKKTIAIELLVDATPQLIWVTNKDLEFIE